MTTREFRININAPNPFTVRPIKTDMTTNELILHDPVLRRKSFVSIEDVGLTNASTYISPQHLGLYHPPS